MQVQSTWKNYTANLDAENDLLFPLAGDLFFRRLHL